MLIIRREWVRMNERMNDNGCEDDWVIGKGLRWGENEIKIENTKDLVNVQDDAWEWVGEWVRVSESMGETDWFIDWMNEEKY